MHIVDSTKKPKAPKVEIKKISSNDLLTEAMDKLEKVVILGIDTQGEMFFSTAVEDKAELIYLLEVLKFDILAGAFDDE
jgi:hypothetical protein